MKRDGRTFDRKTLEEIRFIAVERIREGEPAAKVIEAYDKSRPIGATESRPNGASKRP